MAYRNPGLPSPGKLRTPLEGIDLVADGINRAATLPGMVVGDMLDSVAETVRALKSDIEAPRVQSERPIPPDVLLSPIPKAIGDAVGGVIDTVKAGVDAVVENVNGAKNELDQFIRG